MQFLLVAFAQRRRTELEAFCQKGNVVTILLAVLSSLDKIKSYGSGA